MAGEKAKGGRKNRKYGRNVKFCQKYALENRRAKNKRKKLNRHIAKFPGDTQAKAALKSL
jgi:hypothetical protein